MPGPVFARDGDLTLRTVERDDLPFLQRWQNDPAFRDELGFTVPATADDVERQYEEWTVDSEGDLNLLVCLDERPVGDVALYGVEHDRGELAYWVVPDEQGKGYASRAASLVVDHAFETLALHRVEAKVYGFNDASQGLLESLGFSREGVRRERVFLKGEYQDEHWFGLLRREWREGAQ